MVFVGISIGIIMLLKGNLTPYLAYLTPSDTAGAFYLSSQLNINRKIKALFQSDIVSVPYVIHFWNGIVENIPWRTVWLLPFKYFITNTVREVTFKLIHRFYPGKSFL